jgi:hypothetical protein
MEYQKARAAGIPGEKIIFNGPHKSLAALEQAVADGAMINVDHLDELYDLEQVAQKLKRKLPIGLRLNLDSGIHPQWSRFGFNLETGQALEAVKRIQQGGKLVLNGLHCHLGTFIMETSAYARQIEKMVAFAGKSIRVQPGEWVERGAVLGLCGNSGYSPQPHIHVQVQATDTVGAASLPFSFVSYAAGGEYLANSLPPEQGVVEPLYCDKRLDNLMSFVLDDEQHYEVRRAGRKVDTLKLKVQMAPDGTFYLQSARGQLYFGKHEGTFYCYRLTGQDPWLRLMFLALPRMPLAYRDRLGWQDHVPAGLATNAWRGAWVGWLSAFAPRLATAKVTLTFASESRIESVILPGWGRGAMAAAVELDRQRGFARVIVGDTQLIRLDHAGGYLNGATNHYATVGGGLGNLVGGAGGTIPGGVTNTVKGLEATIGGGELNWGSGALAMIGGGYGNLASGYASTIAGGYLNGATNTYATVGGGYGSLATGYAATVPGGLGNLAGGAYAFAAGAGAVATNYGAFVWADASHTNALRSTANNQFSARCAGGVRFYANSNATVGVQLAAGANAWSAMSDRHVKENFKPIDTRAVLAKLMATPVTEWNLIAQDPAIRHLGPMAQDFKAAFAAGEDDRHISTTDADGVAFAAIQGLAQVVNEKEARIAELEKRLSGLEAQMQQFSRRLEPASVPVVRGP